MRTFTTLVNAKNDTIDDRTWILVVNTAYMQMSIETLRRGHVAITSGFRKSGVYPYNPDGRIHRYRCRHFRRPFWYQQGAYQETIEHHKFSQRCGTAREGVDHCNP